METGASAASWRLFLALWPTAAVRTELLRHADAWRWPPAARRTLPQRLHATLHFIGNVAPQRVPALCAALPAGWEGGWLELDRCAVWPGGIAVLEAGTVPAPLARLHARLAAVLLAQGLPVEARRYRPHVTLARKAQGARPPAWPPIRWPLAPAYALVRSLPDRGGYAVLQDFA